MIDETKNSEKSNRQNFFGRCADIVSRLICVAALVWFGLIAADSVGSFSGAAEPIGEILLSDTIPDLMAPAAGRWNFAQSELSIERVTCDDQELNTRLESLQSSNSNNCLDYDASELVAMAQSTGTTQTTCEVGSVWSFEDDQLRLCLVTTATNPPRLNAAAIAVPDSDRWQLTVLKPQPPRDDHLLPLPAATEANETATQTSCSRCSETGELQMELVSTSLTGNQLLTHWQSHGWNIQHTAWGTADSFSYLCRRGEKVVYAWSASATGKRTLMLTSSKILQSAHVKKSRDLSLYK